MAKQCCDPDILKDTDFDYNYIVLMILTGLMLHYHPLEHWLFEGSLLWSGISFLLASLLLAHFFIDQFLSNNNKKSNWEMCEVFISFKSMSTHTLVFLSAAMSWLMSLFAIISPSSAGIEISLHEAFLALGIFNLARYHQKKKLYHQEIELMNDPMYLNNFSPKRQITQDQITQDQISQDQIPQWFLPTLYACSFLIALVTGFQYGWLAGVKRLSECLIAVCPCVFIAIDESPSTTKVKKYLRLFSMVMMTVSLVGMSGFVCHGMLSPHTLCMFMNIYSLLLGSMMSKKTTTDNVCKVCNHKHYVMPECQSCDDCGEPVFLKSTHTYFCKAKCDTPGKEIPVSP